MAPQTDACAAASSCAAGRTLSVNVRGSGRTLWPRSSCRLINTVKLLPMLRQARLCRIEQIGGWRISVAQSLWQHARKPHSMGAEEYRSRWGARPSKPLRRDYVSGGFDSYLFRHILKDDCSDGA
jgi:hypothetical protein